MLSGDEFDHFEHARKLKCISTATCHCAAVRHHPARSPQELSQQTSGGTSDAALACQERNCFRQERRRPFLSLHFLFKDLTQYQE
jgi:hypothetical protein